MMNKQKLKTICLISLPIIIIVLSFMRFKYVFGSDTDWLAQHTVFPEYFRQIFYSTGKLIPNLALGFKEGFIIFV